MVFCNSHKCGSKSGLDRHTEIELHKVNSNQWKPFHKTIEAFYLWEEAFLSDIQGNHEEELQNYDRCLSAAIDAKLGWKKAEATHAGYLSFLVSAVENNTLREEVISENEKMTAEGHVEDLKRRGFLPNFIDASGYQSIVEYSAHILNLDSDKVLTIDIPNEFRDTGVETLIQLFELSGYQMARLKLLMDELVQGLEKHRIHAEKGSIYEEAYADMLFRDQFYELAPKGTRVASELMSTLIFFELYQTFYTKALIQAAPDRDPDPTITDYGRSG